MNQDEGIEAREEMETALEEGGYCRCGGYVGTAEECPECGRERRA